MQKYIEYFTNYVVYNYDITNDLIKLKYFHSIRVAWLMVILAKKLGLNDEDILLSFKLGLCHDLGRFREVIRGGKFNNRTFDHASFSNKILYNDKFISYMDVNEHLLFRKVIYNHNKDNLTNDLNKREKFFANMLRDMDTVDLLKIRSQGKILKFNKEPTPIVLENYFNDVKININDIHTSSDSIVFYLSLIKDLIFEESFNFICEDMIQEEFLKIVKVSDEYQELFNKVLKKLEERRGKVYVR